MKLQGMRLALIGLIVFLLSFVFATPPDWLLRRLIDVAGIDVRWGSVEGNLLDMDIRAPVMRFDEAQSLGFNQLSIRTQPVWLFAGRLRVVLQATIDGEVQDAIVELRPLQWVLVSLDADLNTSALAPLAPELALAGITAEVHVEASGMRGDHGAFPEHGSLTIGIESLQVEMLIPGRVLGSYELQLQDAPGAVFAGTITTRADNETLLIDGHMELDPAIQQLSLDLSLQPAPTAPDSVRGLLPWPGTSPDGRLKLRLPLSL